MTLSRRLLSCALSLALGGSAAAAGQRPGDARLRARAAMYEEAIASASSRHGVDPRIIWTIAYLETRFRPELTSPAGAGGLCQLMPATAARFGVTDRYAPLQSIEGAAKYVRVLSRMFNGRLDLILAGYNAGEGAVMAFRDGRSIRLPNGKVINPRGIRTGGIPPYRETQNYVALGRQVFAGVDRAQVFRVPGLAPARDVVASGAGAESPAPAPKRRMTRSIYFGDGGAPPPRALELPNENEVAAVFAAEPPVRISGEAEDSRRPARTQSIRFP